MESGAEICQPKKMVAVLLPRSAGATIPPIAPMGFAPRPSDLSPLSATLRQVEPGQRPATSPPERPFLHRPRAGGLGDIGPRPRANRPRDRLRATLASPPARRR